MIFMIWNDWDDWDDFLLRLSEPGWAGFRDEPGFWWWLFGDLRRGAVSGWGSPSGPSLPLALTPALSRRAGEGVLLVVDGGFGLVVGVWACGVVL